MLVTNQTPQDYWFGPLHLPAGVGQQITVDDTSATSLYLTDDQVADAINNLYNSGKISVSSAASPFPRPTGVPQLLHGDGSPEGLIFAPQGSLYMRRDAGGASGLYVKTTGVTLDTGWQSYTTAQVTGGFTTLYDSGPLTSAQATIDSGAGGFSTAFNHLLIRLISRGDHASNNVTVQIRFNNDSGTHYSLALVSAFSGTSTVESYTGTDPSSGTTSIGLTCPAASATPAAWAGQAQIDVPFYAQATFIKGYHASLLGGPNLLAYAGGGWWNSTSAIDRVTLSLSVGNFVAGSRLIVYGYN